MPARERRKGVAGELEVRDVFRAVGLACGRTPNSGGLALKGDLLGDLPVHVEVKRQEVARPWEWYRQACDEAPEGVTPMVAFRRSRSPWLAIIDLATLARLLAEAGIGRGEGEATASDRAAALALEVSSLRAELATLRLAAGLRAGEPRPVF